MNDDANTSRPNPLENRPARESWDRGSRPSKLTDEQKAYVVRRLAAYDRPSKIRRDLREQFGVEISLQGVSQYDPTRVPDTPKEWAEKFFTARKAHIGDQADRAVYSRRIERLAARAIEIVVDRVIKGIDNEGRKMFDKRPEEITDEDRISGLVLFVRAIKGTNPTGYATLKSAFFDEHELRAAEIVAPSPARQDLPAAQDSPARRDSPHAG
jgi:hypothetical protein